MHYPCSFSLRDSGIDLLSSNCLAKPSTPHLLCIQVDKGLFSRNVYTAVYASAPLWSEPYTPYDRPKLNWPRCLTRIGLFPLKGTPVVGSKWNRPQKTRNSMRIGEKPPVIRRCKESPETHKSTTNSGLSAPIFPVLSCRNDQKIGGSSPMLFSLDVCCRIAQNIVHLGSPFRVTRSRPHRDA